MECAAYQIRLFLEGHEIHSAAYAKTSLPEVGEIMDAIGSRWLVLKVERKPSSGDFDNNYDELWVTVERI